MPPSRIPDKIPRMSEPSETLIPRDLQPESADVAYDLDKTLTSIVSLRANIPDDAFTASVLGTERAGHGVLINDTGLILTIGYLVTEADAVWVITHNGQAVPGHLVGYDYETGFGLVQALGRLDIPAMPLGTSRTLEVGDELVMAGFGGREQALKVRFAERREFAGYWEYVLDDALFTSPPHPNWGGAALIGADGSLAGVGSLYIDSVVPSLPDLDGNLSVPIELLAGIVDELQMYGRTLKPARPWLGMFASEIDGHLVVAGMYDDAPAARAGLEAGDVILSVGEMQPQELSSLFRAIWSLGPAGSTIPLRVSRDEKIHEIQVASVDRRDLWKTPDIH